MRTTGPLLFAASLALAACSSAETEPERLPRHIPDAPAGANPFGGPGLLVSVDPEHAIPPPDVLAGDTIVPEDVAALTSSVARERDAARARILEALEGGRALVLVRDDDVYWSVSPELAPALLGLDAATREELALLSGEAGERAFERARRKGDPEALAAALARYPFDRGAASAARARAELLLEEGEVEEAIHAFETAIDAMPPGDGAELALAERRVALARSLRDFSGSTEPQAWRPSGADASWRPPLHGSVIGAVRDLAVARGIHEDGTCWVGACDASGNLRWSVDIPLRHAIVADELHAGRLYLAVGATPGRKCFFRGAPAPFPVETIAALDAASGRLLWVRSETRRTIYLRAGRSGDLEVATSTGPVVLDARTGKVVR